MLSIANPAINFASEMKFDVYDYAVFTILLLASAAVGIYFGFMSKKSDTTDDYLLGERKMEPLPIAISLVASQLSGVAIMSIPAEMYAYGVYYGWVIPDVMFLVTPLLAYLIVPIFYKNNVNNCYEVYKTFLIAALAYTRGHIKL